eukprot:gene9406-19514_t
MFAPILAIVTLFACLKSSFSFQPKSKLHHSGFKRISTSGLKSFQTESFPSLNILNEMGQMFPNPSSLLISEEAITGYSNLSLYFTLALYVLTLPGLFSLVTRAVKVKEVQKFYDIPGPENPTARPLKQTAAEIMAYFKALNYEVAVTEEVITFKGIMGRSTSQAYFLTFCTFVGLGSLGLVLSIVLPDLGSKAYLLTLLSPYAGIYYWNNAQREDTVKIKMETADDGQTTSIIAQGGKEDLERFSKTLLLPERGKVYVKGMFEEEGGGGSSSGIGGADIGGSVLVEPAEVHGGGSVDGK